MTTTSEAIKAAAAANGWTDRTMHPDLPTFERGGVRVAAGLTLAGTIRAAVRRMNGEIVEQLGAAARGKRETLLAWLAEPAAVVDVDELLADALDESPLDHADPADVETGTCVELMPGHGPQTLLARRGRGDVEVEVARADGWVLAEDVVRLSFVADDAIDPAAVPVRQLAPDLFMVGDGRDPFARTLTVLRRGVGNGMAWMIKRDDDDLLARPIRKRDDALAHARKAYARWPHGVPAPADKLAPAVPVAPAAPAPAYVEVTVDRPVVIDDATITHAAVWDASQNDEPAGELPEPAREPRVTTIPGVGRFIDGRAVCSAPDCDEPLPPRAATGRPRSTCSERCRMRKSRAARRNPVSRPAPWVVVPCGADKLTHRAPAGEMYLGSYHAATRRAAEALTSPDRTLILSARHGLLRLGDVIDPYDMTMTHPDSIAGEPKRVARQMRDLGIDGDVVALLPKAYAQVLRAAVRELNDPSNPAWRRPARTRLDERLDGTRGIGEQLGRLARIARAAA